MHVKNSTGSLTSELCKRIPSITEFVQLCLPSSGIFYIPGIVVLVPLGKDEVKQQKDHLLALKPGWEEESLNFIENVKAAEIEGCTAISR